MFRQRMDTTPQWDTVKSRVMVEAQNPGPFALQQRDQRPGVGFEAYGCRQPLPRLILQL